MSVLKGAGALALWLDVDPALDRETDGWYVDEHLPERVDIGGYLRARRYVAVEGAPRYLSLFEAETPQALASAGYLSLVKKISAQSTRIRAGFSNVVRNTFAVRASHGRGTGGVLASLRLTAGDAATLAGALDYTDGLVAGLLREHGIVGVHWLQAAPEVRAAMDSVRAVGQQDAGADYVLLLEATRPEEILALRQGPLTQQSLARAGWREDAFAIYRLLYEVTGPMTAEETLLGDRT
jgi:hypothetical protein